MFKMSNPTIYVSKEATCIYLTAPSRLSEDLLQDPRPFNVAIKHYLTPRANRLKDDVDNDNDDDDDDIDNVYCANCKAYLFTDMGSALGCGNCGKFFCQPCIHFFNVKSETVNEIEELIDCPYCKM